MSTNTPSPGPKVLIIGAGIAGLTAAHFLARQPNTHITLLESSPSIRSSGLGIDIKNIGIDIIRLMGVEAEIRNRTTGEEGTYVVDEHDTKIAAFPASGAGLTAEIEIIRKELCDVLLKSVERVPGKRFDIRFGTTVESLVMVEEGGKVKADVTFSKGGSEMFDVVIAADGLFSKTRDMVLNAEEKKDIIKPLNTYVAYFSIPRLDRDGTWTRALSMPGRRSLVLRPKNESATCAFASVITKKDTVKRILKEDVDTQKHAIAELFAGVGWEEERIMDEMMKAKDFYLQYVAQIKLDKWYKGCCAFVGDAAYSPSPITGLGTTSAIVGAYYLAMEINVSTSRNEINYENALKRYDGTFRPYMNEAQKIPPGCPEIINPETRLGVTILRWVAWLVSISRILKYLGSWEGKLDKWKLPEYDVQLTEI